MNHSQDFKSIQDSIQAALIATTRSVGQITAEDLSFQRSFNSAVGTALDEQSARLLELSNRILKSAASIRDLRAPNLEDVDDVENNWRGIVDVVDSLLEKADASLDEYTGVIKRTSSPVPDHANSTKSKRNPYMHGNPLRTQNLVKPQLAFDITVDNDDEAPWKPLLKSKPHAIVALEDSQNTFTSDLGYQEYQQPYEAEILDLKYPADVFQFAEPIPYTPIDTTTATFVDTYEGVLEMLKELKTAKQIAVDLEHHDARSYVGLVSLMQVSTREKDWIVDTLKPWRQDLQVLNEVFADPNILKVFHGAFMDIVWLQRDLGLYVVGLFDTYHACRTLGYPGASLAYLLKRFVDFDADKKYQLADWRIRPLPEEMLFYARSDTHYLLYIFDHLRNELSENSNSLSAEENKTEITLQKSRDVALSRYERQTYNAKTGKGAGGWYTVLLKTPGLFSNQQFAVFRAVHAWRDSVARKDDDSPFTVMANHAIFKIAKEMPMEITALYSAVHPISNNVKPRIGELLSVVKTAKEEGAMPSALNMLDILRANSASAGKGNVEAKKAISETEVPKLAEDEILRSDTSAFWGETFGSSAWEDSLETSNLAANIKLAIPMPQLAIDSFADDTRLAIRGEASLPEAVPITEYEAPVEDEPFTIKSGKKRKSEAISTEASSTPASNGDVGEQDDARNPYDITLKDVPPRSEEEIIDREARWAARQTKQAEKRKAKKAAKKARVQAEKSGVSTPGSASVAESVDNDLEEDDVDDEAAKEEEEEEPFDYSKAESVLHSKSTGGGKERGARQKKKNGSRNDAGFDKPFDPYKKSEDAAKGKRRVQSEKAGKSFTFRK